MANFALHSAARRQLFNRMLNSRFHDGLIWLQFDTIGTKYDTFGIYWFGPTEQVGANKKVPKPEINLLATVCNFDLM